MTLVDKPLVGFFPTFGSMGETIPLVKIAQAYLEVGGKALFFSHHRAYERFAEERGFQIVRLDYLPGNKPEEIMQLHRKGVPYEKIALRKYRTEAIEKAVREEIAAFKEHKVEMIVSASMLTCSISARASKIPLVVLASGVMMPPYFTSGHATFPENYENFLTKMIPHKVKNRLTGWYLLHNKKLTRGFNEVASRYHLSPFKHLVDITRGDYTLICDDINFLGVQPSKEFPLENYVGPIFFRSLDEQQKKDLDAKIEKHLRRPGKSILVSSGSAYNYTTLFPVLMDALQNTDYNVIAVCKNMKTGHDITGTPENVLLTEFVALDRILQKVDLAITHGGRGTIYTVAYAGKPAICIPVIFENQYNIDNLVRAGAAVRLSKRNIAPEKVITEINTIFDNYSHFLQNAQELSKLCTSVHSLLCILTNISSSA
jgi:UDP:flavonoid glycosyltransferase YjiC (YdhE family)